MPCTTAANRCSSAFCATTSTSAPTTRPCSKTRSMSARAGICDLLVSAMMLEGLAEPAARQHCWAVDSRGLAVKVRTVLAERKRACAHEHAPIGDFLTAIKTLRPTIIIGFAAVEGTFTQEVLEETARINERPDRVRSVQSDFPGPVQCGGNLSPDQGPGVVRLRQPVRPALLDGGDCAERKRRALSFDLHQCRHRRSYYALAIIAGGRRVTDFCSRQRQAGRLQPRHRCSGSHSSASRAALNIQKRRASPRPTLSTAARLIHV